MDTNNEPEKEKGKSDDIPWHPAFRNVIMMELEEYGDDLSFVFEHPLSTHPLRIDILIIKKARGARIDKKIAGIFCGVNVVEYKGPGSYVSVQDFLKVYAYACLYAAIEKGADITDMSITFVGSGYPQKLVEHLQKERCCAVEKKWPGIYIVSGDPLPIQIIDSRELPAAENLWLRGLSNKLDAKGWLDMLAGIARLGGRTGHMGAYIDAIMRANKESLREAYEMSNDTVTMDSVLEEIGLAVKWEARGFSIGEASGRGGKYACPEPGRKAVFRGGRGRGVRAVHIRGRY